MFKKFKESLFKEAGKITLLILTLGLIVTAFVPSSFLVDLTYKDGISNKQKYGDELIYLYNKCVLHGLPPKEDKVTDNFIEKTEQVYNDCSSKMETKHKELSNSSIIPQKQKLILYTALSNILPSLIVVMVLFWMRLYSFKKSLLFNLGTLFIGIPLQYFCLWMINGIGFTNNPIKEYIVLNTVCITFIGTLIISFMDETINTLYKHPIKIKRFPLGEKNLRLIQLSKCQEAMNLQHVDFIKLVALGNGNEYTFFLEKNKFINKQIILMSELNFMKSNSYLEKSISGWKDVLSQLNNPKLISNNSIYDIGVKLNNDIDFLKDELDNH